MVSGYFGGMGALSLYPLGNSVVLMFGDHLIKACEWAEEGGG